jgi:uncharacterized protein (DUF1778 family)
MPQDPSLFEKVSIEEQIDPGCEVVLTPEEYDDFQAMLARPPRVIPALARLMKLHRASDDEKDDDLPF